MFAGYHYDLNFLTIHGKSRYPGLHIWLRDGTRVPVRIPDGCLLLQAGKQLAWLTGGDIMEGMHEVLCTEATAAAIERHRHGPRPLWRISSTVFAHLGPDVVMKPLAGNMAPVDAYAAVRAADYVHQELLDIQLAARRKSLSGA